MRLRLLILLISLSSYYANGQLGSFQFFNASSVALGNQKAVLPNEAALLANFAQLAGQNGLMIELSTNQRFNLSELAQFNAAIGSNISQFGYMGLQMSSYGFDEFQESQINLSYARALNKKINLGLSFGHYRLNLAENGSTSLWTYKINMFFKLNEKLHLGILLENPENKAIHEFTRVNSALAVGMSYKVSDKTEIYSELSKALEQKLDYKLGLRYQIHNSWGLLSGYSITQRTIGFGNTLNLSPGLKIGISANYHHTLGLWPSISISYSNSQMSN